MVVSIYRSGTYSKRVGNLFGTTLTGNVVPLSLQVYEGLVYMDFSKKLMDEQGYGTDVNK